MFNFPIKEKSDTFNYKKNFLKSIIFQIKYPQMNEITEVKNFLDELLIKEFPNKKNIMSGELHMKFDKTPVLLSQSNTTTGFEYKTNSGNHIYSITQDAISLTIAGSEYKNFKESFENYYEVFNAISSKINIECLTRIAIRKINFFEFEYNDETPPMNILQFIIKEPIVSNYFYFPNIPSVSSGQTQLTFNEEDYQLNLSYGMLKEPVVNNKRIAFIDIDLFKSNSEIIIESLNDDMNRINNEIFNVFEFLISDSLRKLLNT